MDQHLSEHDKHHIATAVALRNLIEFIDHLTYAQLEHVPGLLVAARKARMTLPADHIADEMKKGEVIDVFHLLPAVPV